MAQKRKKTVRQATRVKFEHRLVLTNWLLNLFDAVSLEDLANGMKYSDFEGLTENNITKFHQILTLRLFERSELSNDILLAYDQNIVQHCGPDGTSMFLCFIPWIACDIYRSCQGNRE
jgi:hypothetical protein